MTWYYYFGCEMASSRITVSASNPHKMHLATWGVLDPCLCIGRYRDALFEILTLSRSVKDKKILSKCYPV